VPDYLTDDEVDAVRDAAIAAFGADPDLRPLLFEKVLPLYVATLPRLGAPANQIASDIMRMNSVERLVDGSVPLQIWLGNASRMTLQPLQRKTFQDARDKVTAMATGAPDLGAAADVSEVKEEIIFSDDTVAFGFLGQGMVAGRSVGRIAVLPYEAGAPKLTALGAPEYPHAGTAWLVAPTLAVTNHHVVNARSAIDGPAPQASDADLALQAAAAVVRFDYDTEDSPGVDVACTSLEAWSPELDYAVLRLASDPQRRPLPLQPGMLKAGLADNLAVNVIQHPDGKAKRLGIRNNIVHDTTDKDVRYFTDTQRGSSGSPVLTDGWAVCALHRGSRRVDVKFQGKASSYVNVGTQIGAILDDLKARYPALSDEIRP
jgi:endonuclease G, mitochondrial